MKHDPVTSAMLYDEALEAHKSHSSDKTTLETTMDEGTVQPKVAVPSSKARLSVNILQLP